MLHKCDNIEDKSLAIHLGLEINFLKHWPRGPPTLKIWWSCAISGGPVRNNIKQYTGLDISVF